MKRSRSFSQREWPGYFQAEKRERGKEGGEGIPT